MKNKLNRLMPFFIFLCFTATVSYAADPLTLKDVGDELKGYAKDMAGSAGFLSSIGLSWSQQYIGQLIDQPPHWGAGLSVGLVSLKMDHLSKISEMILGQKLEDRLFDKQFLPTYVIETRIGGLGRLPFDFGAKWGMIPSMGLFKNDVKYGVTHWGFDFRYAILEGWGNRPALMAGIEFDRVKGGVSRDAPDIIDNVIHTNGGTSTLSFETYNIDAKAGISKTFFQPSITIFAGIKAGVSIAKAGYSIVGEDMSYYDGLNDTYLSEMNDDEANDLAGILTGMQGTGDITVNTDGGIYSSYDIIGINFNTYEGISFNFRDRAILQLTLMFDFLHFEYGFNLAFRYQQ
ncbi:MAG: hypothetical protein Ta2B_02330 [Termitinemataceae bacterium]|nr:MAG: hypothetical protein Ta2B_02330 [Termitinemataceae bacterium]